MKRVFTIVIYAALNLSSVCIMGNSWGQVRYQIDSITSKPIYFRIGDSNIDPTYEQNNMVLRELGAILTDTIVSTRLDSLLITATASPDGNTNHNNIIAKKRAQAVKGYIENHYPRINNNKIITESNIVNWDLLLPIISADKPPYHTQITSILEMKLSPEEIQSQLKAIDRGKAWEITISNYLPQLRSGVTVAIYTNRIWQPQQEPITKVEPQPIITPTPIVEQAVIIENTKTKRPILALKTNLLYDALTALNIEIEVPIGKHWSIAGEYIFPWWLTRDRQQRLQSLSGYIEGKYWFKNRETRHQLTGWFAGVYIGAGYYDIQWEEDGYQGEFIIPFALSGGYAHSIGRNLSLEYSLGFGYVQTNYREYHTEGCMNENSKRIKTRYGTRRWIGPTKAEVSLVWMINCTNRDRK